MADASDAKIAAGEARPLEGIPLGIKDLFCTEGVETTAGSKILKGFQPHYESAVSANLWRDGAVMLGKLNLDEFAMGSSNETSAFGNVVSPWRRKDSDAPLVPGGSSGGSAAAVAARLCLGATATDTGRLHPPARRLHRHGRHQADLRALLPLGHGGLRLLPRSGGPHRPHGEGLRDPARLHERRGCPRHHLRRPARAGFRGVGGPRREGLTIGIPKEYRVDGMPAEIQKLWDEGAAWLKAAGATIKEISLPHTSYALPAYYIVAPAEASSNLARYDGVRYGLRVPGKDIASMYENTRAAGFGREVKRRIMIGTYVLSAGYYDAYYVRAQKIRTLIKRDFEAAYADGVDAILTPATPSSAFGIGEKANADPVEMYLNDVFTVTVNMAGLPGIAVPAGLDSQGLPWACSSSAVRSMRRRCSPPRR